jgi:hypothetical protein
MVRGGLAAHLARRWRAAVPLRSGPTARRRQQMVSVSIDNSTAVLPFEVCTNCGRSRPDWNSRLVMRSTFESRIRTRCAAGGRASACPGRTCPGS